jgi:hypothetical protein
MRTPDELARHINDLAKAFHVRLDVQRGMPLEFSGAGYRIIVCPQCESKNSIRRAGTIRCGRCKHPLGTHDIFQTILIPIITDEATYAAAMHELGHCLHPTGRVNEFEGSKTMRRTHDVATLRDMRLQLLEETSAWEWARANAIEWTETMQHVQDVALETYKRFARQLGIK